MATSNAPWDGSASRFTPQQWKASCLIDTGEGDPNSKERYKLPVKEPNGDLNANAVRAAMARLPQTQAPAAEKQAAMRKLLAYRKQLGIGAENQKPAR